MVNFINISEKTEYLFYLVRNQKTKYVEIWMKYKNKFYKPLFLSEKGIHGATTNKFLSLNMCEKFITTYVYKEEIKITILEDNTNVVQIISLIKSNITVKFIK